LWGYQTKVAKTNFDAWELLAGTNGNLWNREVTLNNGNLPQKPGNSVSWSAGSFPSVYQQGIRVQNKLVKKLNKRDIDLGVALGEARETAAFVQSAALRLYGAYHAARKRDVSGMLKALGVSRTSNAKRQQLRDIPHAAADVWLEYSYAVRPLLADVYGAVSALEKRHKRPEVVKTRARVTNELDHKMATSGVNPGSADIEWSLQGTLTSSIELSFEIANPFLYTLSQLGLTNPMNVAWELVPFSFVVDWFIPIGSWFDGLVPPQGISSVRGSQSYYGNFKGKGRLVCNFPVPPNTKDGASVFPASWSSVFHGRSPITSYPRYHLVGADFSLSKEQVASGISLLWSAGVSRKAERKALGDVKRTMDDRNWRSQFPEGYQHL
jgi:hypothetical protein